MSEIQYIIRDCEIMAPAEFKGFDAQIVDPPYSAHVHENAVSANRDGRGYVERDLGFTSLSRELRNHICKVAGVVKRWSVVFCDFEGTHLWRQDMLRPVEYVREVPYVVPRDADELDYGGELPWIRWSQPQKSGDRPTQGAEAVLHFHPKGAKRWNGPGSTTHYTAKALRGDAYGPDAPNGKHTTEKPLDLLLNMVSWWSDPDEVVVDLCAGAGTTALACALLGRHCVAIEKDARWAPLARRRLAMEWLDRDVERVKRWIAETRTEATDFLARNKPTPANVNARARAERRLADVARVCAAVGAEAA